MANQQQQQQPNKQQGQKQSNRSWGCIILMNLIMTICLVAVSIWFWNSWGISEADKSIKIGVITLIVTVFGMLVALIGSVGQILVGYFQWRDILFEDIDRWFETKYQLVRLKIGRYRINPFRRKKHFCISYHVSDRLWAEWIAWHLENNGHSTILRDWNGSDFVGEMSKITRKAKYCFTILSPFYLDLLKQEHIHNFKRRNLPGEKSIPIKVLDCKLEGPLGLIKPIDLVIEDKNVACERLLKDLPLNSDPKYKPNLKLEPSFPGAFPLISNVPAKERSPLFTGRDTFLKGLHRAFHEGTSSSSVKIVAICGLSGIGKTQTALQFAYLYRHYYRTILWINASSQTDLEASCESIVHLLKEEDSYKDTQNPVDDLKCWLKDESHWLLILDKCKDLKVVKDFIPYEGRGHVLLTTRVKNTTGVAHTVELKGMEDNEGALFLLRWIGLIEQGDGDAFAKVDNREAAVKISRAMGGLPLGIEHAGAYINKTGCGVSGYLDRYEIQRAHLLRDHHLHGTSEFQTIATTWSLSFREIQQKNLTAAYLLQLCAFLGHSPIPKEIIDSTPRLGVTLQRDIKELDGAITELRNFSLMELSPDSKNVIVHPIVQAVIQEGIYEPGIDSRVQRTWAVRAVVAVNSVFPSVEFPNWELCKRYLPHAQACIKHIQKWNLESQEVVHLLYVTGQYLQERGQYKDAQQLLEQVKTCREKVLGTDPELAACLNTLGELYQAQGKYKEAKVLYEEAKALCEQNKGLKDPYVATILNNLGRLFYEWGIYADAQVGFYQIAEHFYQEALDIRMRTYGQKSHEVAISLNNISVVYSIQGELTKAEECCLLALYLYETETLLFKERLEKVQCRSTLATLYISQEKYRVSVPQKKIRGVTVPGRVVNVQEYYEGALRTSTQFLEHDHPQVARRLSDLAELFIKQKKFSLAEPLYEQALAVYEQQLGPEHPQVAVLKRKYANLLLEMNYGRDKIRRRQKHNKANELLREARPTLAKHNQENPLP